MGQRKTEFTENIVFYKQTPCFTPNKTAAEPEQKISTGNIIRKLVCSSEAEAHTGTQPHPWTGFLFPTPPPPFCSA